MTFRRGVYQCCGQVRQLNFPTKSEVAAANALAQSSPRIVSKFVGVVWATNTCSWQAGISHNQEKIHIGKFPGGREGEEQAARAYDAEARRLRGSAAHGGRISAKGPLSHLNFPTKDEEKRRAALHVNVGKR
jgi:hypothetical protein